MMDKLLDILEHQVQAGEANLVELELLHYLNSNFETSNVGSFVCALYCIRKRMGGHICISLPELEEDLAFFDSINQSPKNLTELKEACNDAPFIGSANDFLPLILEEDTLYIQKFWKYEQELVEWVLNKAKSTHSLTDVTKSFISELFGEDQSNKNHQKIGTYLALAKDLVILTGAPGTGKTFTIKKIVESLLHDNPKTNIAFAAPTGKAAQRMNHSLSEFTEEYSLPPAITLHKLLKIGYWINQAKREKEALNLDVLIVDEASMLDLSLWVIMIRSLPKECKLIVLGDKDQLASVEAGSILGDLCIDANNHFSKEVSEIIERPSLHGHSKNRINDCIIELTKSYRFNEYSGISDLATAINESDADKVAYLLDSTSNPLISRINTDSSDLKDVLKEFGASHYHRFLTSGFSFDVLREYQILCPLKQGNFSSASINQYIESAIKKSINVSTQKEWFNGKPILITRNNNLFRIYNGEIGFISTENDAQNPEVIFENRPEFSLSLSRLSNVESSFAITVHKSQGSEYDHVAIFLGDKENNVLSKQLLYTAVTRARKSVLIVSSMEIIKRTIEKNAFRRSGIRQRVLLEN